MTLNDAYLASQIVAAILVAPTLLYLALQNSQNTKQMRASASFQWIEASGQMNALVAGPGSCPQKIPCLRRVISCRVAHGMTRG